MRTLIIALIGLVWAAVALPASAQSAGPAVLPATNCVMWSSDRVDCFSRGADSKMHHRWREGASWGGWELLGGTMASQISCTSWAVNRIDCFVIGTDRALWTRTWAGGPSWGPGSPFTEGWGSLGGSLVRGGDPSCVTFEVGRIDCFSVDSERVMIRRTFSAGRWGAWERFPGMFLPTRSGPHCVAVDDGSAPSASEAARQSPIWCFARGTDDALWMVRAPRAPVGTTPPTWNSLGGVITSRPNCLANDAFTVRCFVRGTDDAMYWQTIDPRGGQGWRSLGGVLTSEPSCVSYAVQRIDCFVRGTDNALYHMAATPSARPGEAFDWSPWETWGGILTSAPTCTTFRESLHMEGSGHARIDCFVRGTDRGMHHIASYPTGRTPWRSLGGRI